ncbi:MAG: DUF485 domain-containing protein [Proteobacteria bacterium]|nr:DUF485 domain-containing protein [Pseudomonadota bacterium]
MAKSAHEIVSSEKFKKLVTKRWLVSFVLTFFLFLFYYGYIGMIGYAKDVLKIKIGVATNIGIIAGVGVIIGSWLLTVIYVIWANGSYDKTVSELKKELV